MIHLPGDREDTMGAPFALIPRKDSMVVGDFGDIEGGAGARVVIHEEQLLFLATCGGTEMIVRMSIEHMLEKISEWTKQTGS